MSSSDREYAAAVHLNNIGVTLVLRKCYAQGFQTLIDAIVSMNRSICVRGANATPTSSSKSIEAMLLQANSRLAKPRFHESNKVFSLAASDEMDVLYEECFTLDPNMNHLELLFLEEHEGDDVEADLQSCIMLFNVALAYQLLEGTAMQENSMRMLQLSYEAVESAITKAASNTELVSRLLRVACLVLKNLMNVSTRLGHHEACMLYCGYLYALVESSRVVKWDCASWGIKAHAAGAA